MPTLVSSSAGTYHWLGVSIRRQHRLPRRHLAQFFGPYCLGLEPSAPVACGHSARLYPARSRIGDALDCLEQILGPRGTGTAAAVSDRAWSHGCEPHLCPHAGALSRPRWQLDTGRLSVCAKRCSSKCRDHLCIVAYTASAWPDLIVGLGIFLLNLDAAREVYLAALRERAAAVS